MTTVRMTHVGGPTVLIEFDNWRILTDPTFDDPGRTYRFALGTSSSKTTGPAVPVGELGPIDVVLLTHDHHADNLDDAGRRLLATVPTVLTTAAGAARLGGTTRGLEPWASTVLEAPARPSIEVTATPCRHGPPFSRRIVGDVVGFALGWHGQQFGQLWISGDTVLYSGVRQVSRLSVSLAVLHLGGAHFPLTGPVRYTMTAADAVELCEELRPRTVVPVHYEGWSHFGDGRAEIERAVARAPAEVAESFCMLALGEPALLSV
jgi:L-ascorbate metabolism protein UlaG (beta-lactamase superfamily)